MSTVLTPGANAALPPAATYAVSLTAASGHADLIALLLDADGRADGDNGVVLFSQPVSAGGAVRLDLGADTVTIAVAELPAAVERVLVVAQADGTDHVTPCGTLTAAVAADGAVAATAGFSPLPPVATLQLVELYRRAGAWKVRSLGDGYADGLARLLTVHGVDVTDGPGAAADEEAGPAAAAQAQAPPAAPSAAPASPSPHPAPPTPNPATPAPAAAPATGALNLRKAEGSVNLRKGEGAILMEKSPLIRARVYWESGTDYDVYALVLMRDGTAVDVAAFDAVDVPKKMEHAGVRHLGDVKGNRKGGTAEEIIEIRLTPDVLAVVPVAYSAISNGTGSFRKYKVSLEIDNGQGTQVTVPAENGHKSSWVFTCVPGIIKNTGEGVVVEPLEYYSRRASERRPVVRLEKGGEIVVVMDKGAVNKRK